MKTNNIQSKKKNFIFCLCIQFIIWIPAIFAIISVFTRNLEPIYSEETVNSIHPLNTPELKPGESVSQSFRSTHDYLYSVGVAISYKDNIPDDTSVLFQILSGEEIIIEQPLNIWYCPNSGFCTLFTDLQNCRNKTITIRIKNSPQNSENAVFSLLATDKDYLYLDNVGSYLLNDEQQNSCLLITTSYQTGYSYYRALTYVFWIFIITLVISSFTSKITSCSVLHRFSSRTDNT